MTEYVITKKLERPAKWHMVTVSNCAWLFQYRFEWTVWLSLSLLGLLSMLYYTEFGRYRTIYFTGLITNINK